MIPAPPRRTAQVLSSPIDVIDWPTALLRIRTWARAREGQGASFFFALPER